jgi:putative sterol carrier protein
MGLVYGTDEWEKVYQDILQRRLKEKTPPFVQGSPEWVDSYEKLIRGDEEYRNAAAGWEGTVVLHTVAEPYIGIENDGYMLMDLWHGECRSIRLVPPQVGQAADFILTGSYWTWKGAGSGQLDTSKAVMQGKIKLKGELPKIVRYNHATKRLTELSVQLGGRWFDELSADEQEDMKALGEEILARLS